MMCANACKKRLPKCEERLCDKNCVIEPRSPASPEDRRQRSEEGARTPHATEHNHFLHLAPSIQHLGFAYHARKTGVKRYSREKKRKVRDT